MKSLYLGSVRTQELADIRQQIAESHTHVLVVGHSKPTEKVAYKSQIIRVSGGLVLKCDARNLDASFSAANDPLDSVMST